MRGYPASDAPLSERHVQAIWYDSALRPATLRTVRGGELRVVDPGVWNLEAGPDFRRAVLEVGRDRRRVEGDVEIHMRPSDWTSHRHSENSDYAHVVAHVTWYQGDPPRDLPSRCLSICLGDFLRARNDFSPDEIDLAAYPYAKLPANACPCERFFGRNPDYGIEVLRAAGRRRLEIKARRLVARIMRTGDPEQVFYEEMLSAFGYAKNTVPFRALAERLPLRDLPATETAAYEALICVAELDVAARHPWRRANVRPNNAPERRMADVAAIFTGGKPRYLGASHFAVLLANVIVPFALARGALREPPPWLPPEGLNATTRLAAFRLFGRDQNPALYATNGVLLQGLEQIHRDHCLSAQPDCAGCGLVQALEVDCRKEKKE